MKYLPTILLIIFVAPQLLAQSIAEELGYEKDAKLLILHADDLGVAHSVNKASIEAFKSGAINSASIMVPCPWLLEIAEFTKANPQFDLGLHLTFTAEWQYFKWGGVTTSPGSTLLNDHGYMYDNTNDVTSNADISEVKEEIQGQIDMARSVGIRPTHIDSHMGALFGSPALFRAYVETGIENKIPVFVPTQAAAYFNESFPMPEDVVTINLLGSMNPGIEEDDWLAHYSDLLKNAQPGLNEIIVHLGFDDEELQAVTVNHPDFGARWRYLDWQVLESEEFQALIKELDIKLVTYKQIQEMLYGE